MLKNWTAESQSNPKQTGIQLQVQRQKIRQSALDYWRQEADKNALRDLGRRAFLFSDDYQKVLELWIKRGERIESDKDEPSRRDWRQSVVKILCGRRDVKGVMRPPEQNYDKIILTGMKRPMELEKANLRLMLNQTGGDPLMLLNQSGVPPLLILGELEALKFGSVAYDSADEKLSDEFGKICNALNYLAKTFETLKPFMQNCLAQIDRRIRIQEQKKVKNESLQKYLKYDVPEVFTPADHLRLYNLILKNRDEFIWLPARREKGARVNRLLNGLVLSLYEISLSQLRQRFEGRFRPGENGNQQHSQLCFRAIDGLVAGIAFAVFPKAFKSKPAERKSNEDLSDEDIDALLRTVKRTYKKNERWMSNTKEMINS